MHIKISPTVHFKGKRQASQQHVQHDLADKNIHKWVKPKSNNGRKYHKMLPNPLMYFLLALDTYVCICVFSFCSLFSFLNSNRRREAWKELFKAG